MEVIFAKHKNITNYPPSKKFINRQKNAREEEDFKRSRIFGYHRSKSTVNTELGATQVISLTI